MGTMRSCATSRSRTATGGSAQAVARGAPGSVRTGARSRPGPPSRPAARSAARTPRSCLQDTPRAAVPRLLHPIQSLWRWLLRRGLLDPTRPALGRLASPSSTRPSTRSSARATPSREATGRSSRRSGWEFARYLHDCPPDAGRTSQPFLDSLAARRTTRRAAVPPRGVPALSTPERRARCERTGPAAAHRQPRDRLPRADPPSSPRSSRPSTLPYAGAGATSGDASSTPSCHTARERGGATPDTAAAAVLGATARRIERHGAEIARGVITRSLMVLSMPGRVLWLGAHLADPLSRGPPSEITDEDLSEVLVTRFEPVAPAADDCGAHDWSDLDAADALHRRTCSARSTRSEDLFDAPFTDAQVERVPGGGDPRGRSVGPA